MSNRNRNLGALVVSTLACLLVGISASMVTATSIKDWYPYIQKPSWTPPDAVFAPVWSMLYVLMGVSAWLVWTRSAGSARRRALTVFAAQLALNGIWSFLFFGLRSPGWASVEILVLWSAIVLTMVVFRRISRLATALLVPYLLWVSFAVALTLAVWQLNR